MSLNCALAFKGIPKSCLDGNGMILPSGLWFTKAGHQFDTLADAGDDDNWKTGIINGNISMVHGIKEVENLSGEDAVYESPGQDIIFLFSGRLRLKFSVYATPDQHKTLLTYNGQRGRMGFYDRANNIIGTSPDGTIFQAPKLSYLRVGDLIIPTDASPAFTTIEVQFASNTDLNEKLHMIRPDLGTVATRWYPEDLPTLTTVIVEQVGAVTSTDVVIDVYGEESSITNNDGDSIKLASVDGLDVTTWLNFKFVISGVVTPPNSMTDDGIVVAGKARYTAVFTSIAASDSVQIIPTADQPFNSEILVIT